MATSTLAVLKGRFFKALGAYRALTATGGSTSKFTVASLGDVEPNKYRDWQLRVLTGLAAGDLRVLGAGPNTLGELEPKRVFSAAAASTDTAELWGNSIDGGDDLTKLFNDVLLVERPYVDTKITIVSAREVYDITANIDSADDVRRVYIRDLDSDYDVPYTPRGLAGFKVVRGFTTVRTLAISGTPTSGTYTITYNGETTTALVFNATAAAVQAALRLLTDLGSVTVTATGTTPNYTHTIVFSGVAGAAATLTATSSLVGGTPVITIADSTDVPAWWLELGQSFTAQTTPTQELWIRHYTTLTALTDDTSTVQSVYADWLAWEAVLRHAVDMVTQTKADKGNWNAIAGRAKEMVRVYRSIHAPYIPSYIRPFEGADVGGGRWPYKYE